jgi:UPF0176 protein
MRRILGTAFGQLALLLPSKALPTICAVSTPATPFSVVAAYRFVDINDGDTLRQRLAQSAQHAGLKGTLIIASEGINFSLAGMHTAVQTWLDALQNDPRFAPLEIKTHSAAVVPFRFLKVKLKPEIITMHLDPTQGSVRPAAQRADAVDALTLKRWLDAGHCDQGRPVVMLDTRNGFEVDAGAFVGALDWRLKKFSDFPAALQSHADTLKGKTVVSYCTGGIRCEKAALWMAQAGVDNVKQLDGGILRYFEKSAQPHGGAPHWQGECFVFDDRVNVTADVNAKANIKGTQ